MIKSAAAILAAIKAAEKAGLTEVEHDDNVPRRPGRPWLGKKCKHTKYGICYRAVVANDSCRSHHERFLRWGDHYAGGPFQEVDNWCQHCKRRCFLRFVYVARTHRRPTVTVEHNMSNGKRCPGSLRAPRSWRSTQEKKNDAARKREERRLEREKR